MNMLRNTPNFYPICTTCCEINDWKHYFENICVGLEFSTCQKCNDKVVLIDSLFLEIAKNLWTKNYITENSCLGHPKDSYSSTPYISFRGEYTFTNLPPNWYIDEIYSFKTVLRCNDTKNINYYDLLEWTKQLSIVNKKNTLNTLTKLKPKEYNEKLIFFLGKNSLQRNQEQLKDKYTWLQWFKEPKDILKQEDNLIIEAPLLFNFVLELESSFLINPMSDNKIIICFDLKPSLEEVFVPTGISGWGAFLDKKQHGLYSLLLAKYKPTILTGNSTDIFNVYY